MRLSVRSAFLSLVSLAMFGCGGPGANDLLGQSSSALEFDGMETAHVMRVHAAHHRRSGGNLFYGGGVGGIGVETAPKIYLVLWGSQWNNNDPSGEASILQSFYTGAGNSSSWDNSVTQYCQNVPSGTINCAGVPGAVFASSNSILAGVWADNASAAPSQPTQSQIANEAINAAAHFGNTGAGSNNSTQYVIATAAGNNSRGFGTQYCAYHSSISSSFGNVAYTNLPYITDAGASCGANFNGLGPNAGITIVSGHEFAETQTDQFPNGGGWTTAAERMATSAPGSNRARARRRTLRSARGPSRSSHSGVTPSTAAQAAAFSPIRKGPLSQSLLASAFPWQY